jgi:acetylornithine aminotransferase
MPGYRSGFIAGDPALIAALKKYRPNVGTAPQTFVQRASVAAWDDDGHVAEIAPGTRASARSSSPP